MGTGPGLLAVGVFARQVGGHREALEIIGLKGHLTTRGRQLGVGISPLLPPEGLPTSIERVDPAHRLSHARMQAR
jgi:hypothetical protein